MSLEPILQTQVYSESNPPANQRLKTNKPVYVCQHPGCGKSFRYKSEIDRHQNTHKNDRPYTCEYNGCTKSFKREDALKNHMRIHTQEKIFQCNFPGCGESFISMASLRYHELKHTKQKKYLCNYPGCNKVFYTKFQLNQHLRSINVHKNLYQGKSYDDQIDTDAIMADSDGISHSPPNIYQQHTSPYDDIEENGNNSNNHNPVDFQQHENELPIYKYRQLNDQQRALTPISKIFEQQQQKQQHSSSQQHQQNLVSQQQEQKQIDNNTISSQEQKKQSSFSSFRQPFIKFEKSSLSFTPQQTQQQQQGSFNSQKNQGAPQSQKILNQMNCLMKENEVLKNKLEMCEKLLISTINKRKQEKSMKNNSLGNEIDQQPQSQAQPEQQLQQQYHSTSALNSSMHFDDNNKLDLFLPKQNSQSFNNNSNNNNYQVNDQSNSYNNFIPNNFQNTLGNSRNNNNLHENFGFQ